MLTKKNIIWIMGVVLSLFLISGYSYAAQNQTDQISKLTIEIDELKVEVDELKAQLKNKIDRGIYQDLHEENKNIYNNTIKKLEIDLNDSNSRANFLFGLISFSGVFVTLVGIFIALVGFDASKKLQEIKELKEDSTKLNSESTNLMQQVNSLIERAESMNVQFNNSLQEIQRIVSEAQHNSDNTKKFAELAHGHAEAAKGLALKAEQDLNVIADTKQNIDVTVLKFKDSFESMKGSFEQLKETRDYNQFAITQDAILNDFDDFVKQRRDPTEIIIEQGKKVQLQVEEEIKDVKVEDAPEGDDTPNDNQ